LEPRSNLPPQTLVPYNLRLGPVCPNVTTDSAYYLRLALLMLNCFAAQKLGVPCGQWKTLH